MIEYSSCEKVRVTLQSRVIKIYIFQENSRFPGHVFFIRLTGKVSPFNVLGLASTRGIMVGEAHLGEDIGD